MRQVDMDHDYYDDLLSVGIGFACYGLLLLFAMIVSLLIFGDGIVTKAIIFILLLFVAFCGVRAIRYRYYIYLQDKEFKRQRQKKYGNKD